MQLSRVPAARLAAAGAQPTPQVPPFVPLCATARRPRRLARTPPRAAFEGAPVVGERSATAPAGADWRVTALLKEWSSVCASLAAGQTTVLLRKGGIAEKGGFKVQARRFALYPSAFHTAAELLQPRAQPYADAPGATPGEDAQLALLAECTAAWQTDDPAVLGALTAFHPWTERLLETRFQWKPSQPITVMELRALRLPQPVLLRGEPEHGGCRSWIRNDDADAVAAAPGASFALDDAAFAVRQAETRAALQTLRNVVPIPLPDA